MEKQILEKPASVKQLAYIKRLSQAVGLRKFEFSDPISSSEASRLIGELISKTRQNEIRQIRKKINEPRLGMAMKECFRLWTALGRDVIGNRRNAFIQEAISTYELFTEIAEQLETETRDDMGQEHEGAMEADSAA